MYFHSSSPFIVKVMSSPRNVWAANRIYHICNTVIHRFPISGLFMIYKRSQRDNFYNSKYLMAFQKKYITPQTLVWGAFL